MIYLYNIRHFKAYPTLDSGLCKKCLLWHLARISNQTKKKEKEQDNYERFVKIVLCA